MKIFFIHILLLLIGYTCFGQNTILWKVSDTITGKSSFLVGTFHQFGNSFVDSIPELKDALLQSELAIFESIDDIELTRKMINSRTQVNQIEKQLKRKDFQKLKQISKNWNVDLYKLKPIELRWKLQQEFQIIKCRTALPTDKWDHFDNYLTHIAKENGIALYGLETDSLQLSLIEKEYQYPNWKKEKKNISFWIEKLTDEELAKGDCSFTNKYREFDLDYEFTKDCPSDILIKQRNEDWMKIIPDLVKNNNCFIAVGYLHLKNKCGLIEQLRVNGFSIEPIKIRPAGNNGYDQ